MKVVLGTILLVENDPDYVFLVKRAFQEAGIPNPLRIVHHGLQALQYLNGENGFSGLKETPIPMLVLLDLDMPVMNGFDLLLRLRQNPRFAKLPVVVFTASSLSPDVPRAYRLGANAVLTKPANIEHLKTMLKGVIQFWGAVHAYDCMDSSTAAAS